MKVTLHQPTQFYTVNNKTNISSPINNFSSKINLQSRDTVSFGHYLDDEKEEQEKALRRVENSIDSVKSDISSENSSHASEVSSLNRQIRELNTEVNATSNEISALRDKVSRKDAKIKQVKSEGQSLEIDVKSGKETVSQLEKQHKEILHGMAEDTEFATKMREEKLGQQSQQMQKIYAQDMENAVAGAKNKLIQNIINPTIQESEGDNILIPSSLLIESDSDDVAKKVFGWITKKTGSNYAIVDAQECENKSGLMSLLTHVSEKAKKDFDASRVRTFTLIENFDSFVPAQNEANDSTYKSFKGFISKCSELYNNTIVAVTKSGSKINETNESGFNIKLNLDSVFMQDKRLGYDSILNELKELKTLGKNHLFSAFEGLRKV
jgi:hypothetical protein